MDKKRRTVEHNRERNLWQNYKITSGEYQCLFDKQGGKCAICKRVRSLVVDHCHKTGKIRGLLCSSCNSAIGLLDENVGFLNSAIDYLG